MSDVEVEVSRVESQNKDCTHLWCYNVHHDAVLYSNLSPLRIIRLANLAPYFDWDQCQDLTLIQYEAIRQEVFIMGNVDVMVFVSVVMYDNPII